MNGNAKDNLGYYGEKAQYALVRSLIDDKQLYISTRQVLKPQAFSVNELSTIVKMMNEYYDSNGMTLGFQDLKVMLKSVAKNDDELKLYQSAFEKIIDVDTSESEISTNACIEMLRQQETLRVLSNGIASIKKGFSDERYNRIIDQLRAVNQDNGMYDIPTSDELMDMVSNTTDVDRVPSGIEELDNQMKGGLPLGSVGLLIAGTGVGKTTLGSIMSIGAAMNGCKVLHIFFEDLVPEIGAKYYAAMTGRYTYEFFGMERNALGEELLSNDANRDALSNIKPVRMLNGETTVEDIVTLYRRLKANGWKADMVFIDYMSCLRTTTNEAIRMQNEYQALERCMRKIELFANEEHIAVWVAQQTNRDAFREDTAYNRIGNVQGSFRITQPASFILYLKRNNDTQDYNRADLYLDKCRGCMPKAWTNIMLNNGNCQIDLGEQIINIDELEWRDDDDDYKAHI